MFRLLLEVRSLFRVVLDTTHILLLPSVRSNHESGSEQSDEYGYVIHFPVQRSVGATGGARRYEKVTGGARRRGGALHEGSMIYHFGCIFGKLDLLCHYSRSRIHFVV